MIVMITKRLRICSMSDGRCFRLENLKKTELGLPRWEGWGYYGTLAQAASKALDKSMHTLSDSQKRGLADVLQAIKEAEAAIVSACEAACEAREAAGIDLAVGKNIPDALFEETGTDG